MFRLTVTGLEGKWSEMKVMLSDIGHLCSEMNPFDLISIRMIRSDSLHWSHEHQATNSSMVCYNTFTLFVRS